MKKDEQAIKILIYLVWIFLFVVGIIETKIYYSISSLLLAFAYFHFKKVPKYVHLLLALTVVLGMLGEIFLMLYYHHLYYDKILHVVNPIIGCLFVYYLIKDKFRDKRLIIAFCAFAVISFALGWEIFEYGYDNLFGGTMQGVSVLEAGYGNSEIFRQIVSPVDDTMVDMILTFAGTIVFALGFWLKKKV